MVESGPVVGVWLRSWKVLEKLGLARDLQQATGLQPSDQPGASLVAASHASSTSDHLPVNTFNFRKSDGPQGIDFFQLVTRGKL